MDYEDDSDSYGDSIADEDDEYDEDYDPGEEEEEEVVEEAENEDEEDNEEDDDDGDGGGGGGDDEEEEEEDEEEEEHEGEIATHAEIDEEDDGGGEEEGEESEGEFADSSDSEGGGGFYQGWSISRVGGLAPPAAVVVSDRRRDLVAVETPAGEGKECEESSGPAAKLDEEDRSIVSCCPICYEPWTCSGDHRVCCIPCGHIYGRSCLEKWLQRCQRDARECPQCKKKFEPQQIVNLYAPPVVLQNDDLEKVSPRTKEFAAMEERLQRMNEVVKEMHQEMEEKFQSMHVAIKDTHQEIHDIIRAPAGELRLPSHQPPPFQSLPAQITSDADAHHPDADARDI